MIPQQAMLRPVELGSASTKEHKTPNKYKDIKHKNGQTSIRHQPSTDEEKV